MKETQKYFNGNVIVPDNLEVIEINQKEIFLGLI